MKEKIAMFFGIRKGGKSFDKYSLYAVLISLAVTIILTLWEVFSTASYNFVWWGALIFLVGAFIRTTARLQLGKLFTFNVKIMQDHKLKQDGLYKYIRHPGYTGILIEVIGWCIFFQTFWGTLSAIIFILPAGYYRIKVEEQTLEKNILGYTEYKKKVKAIIPFLF